MLGTLLLCIIAFFIPPFPVVVMRGCGGDLVINVALTLLFWFPGVGHALYIIVRYAGQKERRVERRRSTSSHTSSHRRSRSLSPSRPRTRDLPPVVELSRSRSRSYDRSAQRHDSHDHGRSHEQPPITQRQMPEPRLSKFEQWKRDEYFRKPTQPVYCHFSNQSYDSRDHRRDSRDHGSSNKQRPAKQQTTEKPKPSWLEELFFQQYIKRPTEAAREGEKERSLGNSTSKPYSFAGIELSPDRSRSYSPSRPHHDSHDHRKGYKQRPRKQQPNNEPPMTDYQQWRQIQYYQNPTAWNYYLWQQSENSTDDLRYLCSEQGNPYMHYGI